MSAALLAVAASASSQPPREVVWGILGTGAVAHDFTTVLQSCAGCRVKAVGSRSAAGAERFGEAHGIETRYGTYEALAADPEIDVVYVASPSASHVEHSELCLRWGRAVLCEKSMALDAEGARRVQALAQSRQLFFMHGVWTRHFPAVAKLRELVRSGALGEVRHASVDFNQPASASGEGALGEGAMLETGVYPLALLEAVLGPHDALLAAGQRMPKGAESQVSMVLRYNEGATLAHVHCGLTAGTPREATFVGTKATAVLPFPFWCPDRLILLRSGGDQQPGAQREELVFPLPEVAGSEGFNYVHSEGFAYEIAETNRCILAGALESHVIDGEANLRILGAIDEARRMLRAAD